MGWESLKEDTTVKDMKDLMTHAIRALKAGRKEEAYRLFSEVVDLDPTNEDALLGKAGCSTDLDETILLLQKIVSINPSNERAREGLEWAIERRRTVSETWVGLVAEHKERSSPQALDAVREETEEVQSRQRRVSTSTIIVSVTAVLYGFFGLFNGVKDWIIMTRYGGGFDFPSLPSVAASRALFLAIEGFLLSAIAMSLLDSTQRKLRSLGVKQAGLLVPVILLFLAGIIGALFGYDSWVNWGGTEMPPNMFLRISTDWDLPALVLDVVDYTGILGPFLFVVLMVVWWVVVALWRRLASRSRQT